MNYYTSDWHLGDPRLGIDGKPNLFYRPFKSILEQNNAIMDGFFNSDFKDGDTLWHLGDVLYNEEENLLLSPLKARYPNSKFKLIIGNYDEDKVKLLSKYFDEMYDSYTEVELIQGSAVYLNHYPANCTKHLGYEISPGYKIDLAITGHIHGLWKVQSSMINVGVDAWHFKPVSETEILFCWNAMQKFYDENVFPYTWNK